MRFIGIFFLFIVNLCYNKTMVKEELKKLVYEAVLKAQKEKSLPKFKVPEIEIEKPRKEIKNFGDLASPFPFEIAKIAKKNPQKIAEIVVKNILASKHILEVKAVAGFLNFFLSPFYFQEQIPHILKEKENFGQNKLGGSEKVNIEFISANPTGPITVGNARGGFAGDTLANILSFAGFQVSREYYINDYGKQILIFGESVLRRLLEAEKIKVDFPDYCYQGEYIKTLASEAKKELKFEELNKNSLENKDIIEKIADFAISKMVAEACQATKKLGIKYNEWFSEKSLYKKGEVKKVLEKLEKKKLLYKKDGAVWLKVEKLGGPKDEVLLTSSGEETYFLGDIAYHYNKFERGFEKIIVFLGSDHFGHVARMAILPKLFGFKGELKFLVTQFVRLKEKNKKVGVSKRKGQIFTLEELVDKISLPVARYMFLTKDINSQMELDLDLLKQRTKKNPVFYVQYAHARMSSILRKAREKQLLGVNEDLSKAFFSLLNNESEIALIKKLIEFPEVAALISKNYEVHILSYYTYSLAEKFSLFYRDCPVISEKKEDLRRARLGLVIASQTVLQNTLRLMGIEAPEVM